MEHETRNIRFSDFTRPFRRNLWLIIIPFVSIVGTVGVLTFLAQPIYESKAAVYIGSSDQLNFDANQVAVQRYMVKNQIPILKSRRLAADVIRRFQNSEYKDSLLVLGTTKLPPRIPLIRRITDLFYKSDREEKPATFIQLVEDFRDATKISEQLETNVILLIARSPSIWEATYMVNTWVDAYLDYDQLLSQGDASENKRFLESKLNEVERDLKTSETALMSFQKREQVVSLNNETDQLIKQLAGFESQYNQTRTELESIQNQLVYLKDQLDENRRNFVDDILKMSSPVLQELQQQMAELVTEKAAYEAQLIGAGIDPDGDGRFAQMESRLNGIREKIIDETSNYMKTNRAGVDPVAHTEALITEILQMETQQQSLEAKSHALKKVVDEYTGKLTQLPEKSLRLAQLERDVQVNREIYTMLRQKFEEAKIKATGLGGNIVVLDRGQPPLEPVYPRKRMNLILAALVGLFIGLCLAFARDYFEDSLWHSEEVEALDLKVIGAIPEHLEKPKTYKTKSSKMGQKVERVKAISPYLIIRTKTPSPVPEAIRVIRTFIHYKMQNEKVNTLLVSSPGPSEGKSTTAANIAIASAQKGIRTLLVDCDLRKPVQDLLLNGISRPEGLVSYILDNVPWKEIIRETPVKRLDLMAAGAPTKHASELLSSKRMFQFILEASKAYPIVIFDCPPVLPVTDAIVLSEKMKGVILTVKIGTTTRHGLKLTLKRLQDVQAPVWGAVLTGMPKDSKYGYEAYYEAYDESLETE